MAISFGTDNEAQGGGAVTSVQVTLTGVTAGDLIVAVGTSDNVNGAATPFSSSPSETWQVDASRTGASPRVYIGSAIAGSSGTYTIIFTLASSDYPSIWACRCSGSWDSSRKVDSATNNGTGTAVSTANMDTTAAALLVLGHSDQYNENQSDTVTPNTNWTETCDLDNDLTSMPIRTSYRVVTGSGAYGVAATYSASAVWAAAACAYQEVAGGTTRELIAAIAGVSSTPNAAATTTRALLATIAGVSTTPNAAATLTRALLAAIAASSTTPDATGATITRALLAAISGTSITPDASATIIRALLANIQGESVTSDVTATIQGIISLIAAIAGTSSTPDVTATVTRALAATVSGASVTQDIAATLTRALLAAISGTSSTTDITATLENVISLSAAIVGVSLTGDIAATIARSLSAAIAGASTTTDVITTTVRQLLAAIAGTSVTPDDLVLILAGLGVILDPTIESATVERRLVSVTPAREIVSATTKRMICAA